MAVIDRDDQTKSFLKSLGFPDLNIHHSVNHYDFTKSGRRIMVIGPMGSGKTEFSARIYRDSQITLKKSEKVSELTTNGGADRRIVFYIRYFCPRAILVMIVKYFHPKSNTPISD